MFMLDLRSVRACSTGPERLLNGRDLLSVAEGEGLVNFPVSAVCGFESHSLPHTLGRIVELNHSMILPFFITFVKPISPF